MTGDVGLGKQPQGDYTLIEMNDHGNRQCRNAKGYRWNNGLMTESPIGRYENVSTAAAANRM